MSYYRPELPKSGSSSVWFDYGSPGFNGYFKWHKTTYGTNPSFNAKGLSAPSSWQMPDDWTFSDATGHWYNPSEMKNAGFSLIDGEWLHPNDIRKREIDKENADIESRIAARNANEKKMRQVHALGRKKTILTGPVGVSGVAKVEKQFLQNSKGVMQ